MTGPDFAMWASNEQIAALVAASGHTESDAVVILRRLYLSGWMMVKPVSAKVLPPKHVPEPPPPRASFR